MPNALLPSLPAVFLPVMCHERICRGSLESLPGTLAHSSLVLSVPLIYQAPSSPQSHGKVVMQGPELYPHCRELQQVVRTLNLRVSP